MPDLPTITVTQAQADRMLAAYGSVANYRLWLKTTIIQYVTTTEMANLKAQHQQDERDIAASVNDALS
jgi:hypothetical protein